MVIVSNNGMVGNWEHLFTKFELSFSTHNYTVVAPPSNKISLSEDWTTGLASNAIFFCFFLVKSNCFGGNQGSLILEDKTLFSRLPLLISEKKNTISCCL